MESAYGLAITVTMLMTTLLLFVYLSRVRGKKALAWGVLIVFGAIETVFFLSSLSKFAHGRYVAVIMALLLLSIMIIWHRGTQLEQKYSVRLKLGDYTENLAALRGDSALPELTQNLVYIGSSDDMETIDRNTLYSILDKDPKRARAYWFLSVHVLDEPNAMNYQVETFGTDYIFRVKLNLGFKNDQRVNIYLRQIVRDLLESGQPFLFGRCGATEMRTVADWLQNGGHNFTDRTRADIRNLSGVFPTDDATLDKFCRLYVKNAQSAELLALWNVGAEREVIRGCDATRFTELRALEPYYHARPWSAALAGKRVLVVHPFRRTILAQYEKRTQLFPGKDVLPELACLTVIQAVQGLGGQDTGYADWFDALTEMERRMDAADYDVAIVGAGAYSLPLAAHARDTGHAAIQMSGATQLLFGIKGKRWDDHPVISKLYNPAWVRPDETEGISNKEKVEGGSYW